MFEWLVQNQGFGGIYYFLGLQFNKLDNGFVVHQQKNITDLLRTYYVMDMPAASMPLLAKLH